MQKRNPARYFTRIECPRTLPDPKLFHVNRLWRLSISLQMTSLILMTRRLAMYKIYVSRVNIYVCVFVYKYIYIYTSMIINIHS